MYISVSLVVYFCSPAALILYVYWCRAVPLLPYIHLSVSPEEKWAGPPATINTFPSPQNEKL